LAAIGVRCGRDRPANRGVDRPPNPRSRNEGGMSTETRTLPGYSRYIFCSDGAVLFRNGRPVRGSRHKCGYISISLTGDSGHRKRSMRATWICQAFHGPRPDRGVCRHLDGSRTNDAASNLAWGTQKDNLADAISHGTVPLGEQARNAKLSEAQAREVLRTPEVGNRTFARRWGVSPWAIYAIRRQLTWKWL
jgi:hypothetical protein